jgi:hypothetical protein
MKKTDLTMASARAMRYKSAFYCIPAPGFLCDQAQTERLYALSPKPFGRGG